MRGLKVQGCPLLHSEYKVISGYRKPDLPQRRQERMKDGGMEGEDEGWRDGGRRKGKERER